jgi:hypothetical protein
MKKIFSALFIIFTAISCSSPEAKDPAPDPAAAPVDPSAISSSCPFLTSDDKGNIVLSWVRDLNDSASIMCYAISSDKGRTFGKPVEIPSSSNVHPHGENMPKIIFKPGGEIIAAWGASNSNPKNKYSGLVFYTQSFDAGKSWTEAKPLVTDTASYDQRYFDMGLLPNGEAGIIWLDNRKEGKAEGSTLYFASTKGKNGFQDETPVAKTICQCCRTDLFIDKKGSIHASFRDIINDSIRDMVHIVSTDNGKTFSAPERISKDNWVINGCPHTGPAMTQNKNGFHFAWYTMGNGQGVFYCNSKDNCASYSSRDSVSGRSSAKHPQIITLQDDDLVVVWDETVQKGEKYNAWIGLQQRDAEGKTMSTRYVSPDTAVSEFPVILSAGDNSIVLAYSTKGSKNKQVVSQVIHLTE